jgi:hypothetical protein
MPRPSPNERRKIEARRKANAQIRDTEAERKKQMDARVQSIISAALDRPRSRELLPDLHSLLEKLESAYDLAMATNQANSAIAATMAMGRLLGLVIDKSAVAVAGQVSVFGAGSRKEPQTIEDLVDDIRETLGPRATQRFIEGLKVMGVEFDDDDNVIEGRRIGNGDANGVDHD